MVSSIKDWRKLFKQCYEWVFDRLFAISSLYWRLLNRNTKPGGWAEFKDYDVTVISTDNSLPKDSYIQKYHDLCYEALNIVGASYAPGPELKKWAKEAGYINVTEKVTPLPIGMWPKDKLLV